MTTEAVLSVICFPDVAGLVQALLALRRVAAVSNERLGTWIAQNNDRRQFFPYPAPKVFSEIRAPKNRRSPSLQRSAAYMVKAGACLLQERFSKSEYLGSPFKL